MKKAISVRGRVMVGVATFFCLAITYMQRQTINVVVAQIVSINKKEPRLFNWTKSQKSVVLMSFYAGYCFTQILGGMAAERYGAKITLSISILISSILTVLTPICFETSPYYVVALRVISGVAQGVFFPCFSVIMANWYPSDTRTSAIGLIFPGTYCGTIIALIVSSGLAYVQSLWKVSFYLFGIFGFIWLVFWQIFMSDDSQKNRFIKDEEKQFLKERIERKQVTNIKTIPWKAMFMSKAFLAIFGSQLSAAWNLFLIATIIPSYIADIYYVQVKDQVYITFLTPVLTWLGGTICSIIGDVVHAKYKTDKLKLKKFFNGIGMIPTGVFLLLSTIVSPDKFGYGILFILLACFTSGIFIAATIPNIGDVAPQYFGIISGIINTLGAVSGLISTETAFIFVSDTHQPREWQYVYSLALAVNIIGWASFHFCCKGTIQPWAVQKSEEKTSMPL